MKKFFLFLTLTLFATISIAAAQTSTMKFTVDTWDFGAIKEESGEVSHTFQFINTGDKPFVIESVATTCGCTTPRYSRQPIMPGKAGTIEITYDPQGRPGPFNRDVVIVSNGRTNRNVVKIIGEVTPRPMTIQDMYPASVGQGVLASRTSPAMGYVGRGTSEMATLEVYNNSQKDITLAVAYDKPSPYFRVQVGTSHLKPAEKGTLIVVYDLKSADVWGMLSDTFYLTVNGVKAATPFITTAIATEDFSALSYADIAKSPQAMLAAQYYHFGDVRKGTERPREFTITNNGETDLVIHNVSRNDNISSDLASGTVIKPGGEKKFTITLKTTNAPAGAYVQSLVIIMNDPQRPMREIRLAATII